MRKIAWYVLAVIGFYLMAAIIAEAMNIPYIHSVAYGAVALIIGHLFDKDAHKPWKGR